MNSGDYIYIYIYILLVFNYSEESISMLPCATGLTFYDLLSRDYLADEHSSLKVPK